MDSSRIDGVIREQFFALLRAGLWGEAADEHLFGDNTDWGTLFDMARLQAVIGIAYDGMKTLPAHCRPPRNIYLQWCATIVQIEDANALLNRVMCEVIDLYEEAGIAAVVLKGQGIAQLYRHPERRQCDNVDIYVSPRHYSKANEILRFNGAVPKGEEGHKQTSYAYHGVHIENHRLVGTLNSPLANHRFQRWVRLWYEDECTKSVRFADPRSTGERTIQVPPNEFNAIYLLQHAFAHFLNSGIDLRHVCDWARFMYTLQKEPKPYHLAAMGFARLGLQRAAWAFAHIAVVHLGLPANRVDTSFDRLNDPVLGEKLLDDIWQTGNFGQHDARIAPRPKGYWAGKWYTFERTTRRCKEFSQFAPAEARWYALAKECKQVVHLLRKCAGGTE